MNLHRIRTLYCSFNIHYNNIGPLVLRTDGNDQPILIGVTSWNGACGYASDPDVFGRVLDVVDWIKQECVKMGEGIRKKSQFSLNYLSVPFFNF